MEQSLCDSCSKPLEDQVYILGRIDDDERQFKICNTCRKVFEELIEQGYIEVIADDSA